jgi:hypothetical protein
MATANAMDLQMTMQDIGETSQQMADMPCHDSIDKKETNSHNCIGCGFCVVATSIASFHSVPTINVPAIASINPAYIDVIFKSADQSPAFRPPILN